MTQKPAQPVPFAEALRFWLKLGFISFGGPTGQIAIMHQELVERRRWISENRFLHALNYCMVLPGPEAQQLATYIGWLMHRTWGGLAAGGLFVLPSVFILVLLSWIYLAYGDVPLVAGLFYGIKPAVTAIVVAAAIRIGSRALKNAWLWSIAVAAFVAIFALKLPFPAIVVGAGIVGYLGGRFAPSKFRAGGAHAAASTGRASVLIDDGTPTPAHARFSWGRFWAVLGTGVALWGLALGETTPGPLIMVVAFVGFLGGWNAALFGPEALFAAGLVAAVVVTFFTFLPSFVLIFAGAPFVETTHGNLKVTAPLAAITAAVVGVILNLALFFAYHVLWPKGFEGRFEWLSALLGALAFVAILRYKVGIIPVIGVCALAGLLARLAGIA